MDRRGLALGLLAGVLVAAPVRAQPAAPNVAFQLGPIAVHGSEPDLLQAGAGAFDFVDDDVSAAVNAEFRFGRKLFVLGPAFGLMANTDGGIFGYAGGYVDLSWGRLHLTPMLAFGGYHEGGSKDLGGVFQFRQSVELAWRFDDGSRLGVRAAHISNAGIHEHNPGVEEIYLTYAIPFGPFD
jgi:lipid A 3-O-deacylase